MTIRRKNIICLSCDNKALVVIKDIEVIDEIEYCPFCGVELELSKEEIDNEDW